MIQSRSIIATKFAVKYLTQLSKHWSHKFSELTYSETEAHIPFSETINVDMFAEENSLVVQILTPDEFEAFRIEGIFANHLQRFAFREQLTIDWHRKTLS